MSQSQVDFDRRLQAITSDPNKSGRSRVVIVDERELIVGAVSRRRYVFPLRGTLVLFGALLAFKVFLISYLGEGNYQDRVGKLADGTAAEKVGAWVMQVDPLTGMLVEELRTLF